MRRPSWGPPASDDHAFDAHEAALRIEQPHSEASRDWCGLLPLHSAPSVASQRRLGLGFDPDDFQPVIFSVSRYRIVGPIAAS